MTSNDPLPSRQPPPVRRRWAAFAAAGALAVLVSGCGGGASAPIAAPTVSAPEDATAELTEADVSAWLDGMLPSALENSGIAGASVSVVSEGELLTTRGYGYSDLAEREPVDPEETLFRVASISKVFTATAVMTLVEDGKLDLDTDVDEYLDFEVDRAFDEDLTLRHLLTHTGGFEERIANAMPPEGMELRTAVAEDAPAQLYRPGTTPAYSNYGIALAGYIAEQVSGVPFDDLVEKEVLAPAGMDSSTMQQPLPEGLQNRLSQAYPSDEQPPVEQFENVSDAPAGALTSSATDMARFMQVHMESSRGAGILQPETIAEMHQPGLGEESLGGLAAGGQMGLGFFLEERNGHRVVSHGGDTNLFHSQMNIYPEQNAGIFVTLNSSGNAEAISHHVRVALTDAFADRYFPGGQGESAAPSPEPTAAEHAAALQGTYATSRAIRSNFVAVAYALEETEISATEDGTITLTSPETGKLTEYVEVEPWLWREIDGHRTLAADVVDGEVRAIGTTAFSLLPVDPETQGAVAIPIAGASVLVLLLALVSWPVSAVTRWRLKLPRRPKDGRWARVLTRSAVAATLLAFGGWILAMTMAMSFVEVPFGLLRVFQAVQGLGVLGFIPAGFVLYHDIRNRAGWLRYAGSALVLTALLGAGWIALVFGMVTGSVSF